jgi:hypothetical protein
MSDRNDFPELTVAQKTWVRADPALRIGTTMIEPCPNCGHREVPPCDRCVSCGGELVRVFPDSGGSQYDNALEIELSGGYGMFFDSIDGD